jgi:ribosomal protein L11 methyltransferase
MPPQSQTLWQITVDAPDAESAEAVVAALDGASGGASGGGCAVSAFESVPGGAWRIDALSVASPDRGMIEARLALAWSGRSGAPPPLKLDRVPARDWLAENQAGFPPITAGRFFIHGSHFKNPVPAGAVALLIDAATAFGTGEHGSTQGCLLALDRLARRMNGRGSRPRIVLDMGAGTGVLALAAAKLWRRPVAAFDIDAESVRVARHNAKENGLSALIAARQARGYRSRQLWKGAPYDLILSNILARPLAKMARDLSRALAPRGVAVLAGLLPRQESFVLAAHRAIGLHLVARLDVSGWRCLVLSRSPMRSLNIPTNLKNGKR